MEKPIRNVFITIVATYLLFLFGCNRHNETFLTQVIDLPLYDNGGKGLYDSRIALNDSVLLIKNTIMAKSAGYIPVSTDTRLFVDGKEEPAADFDVLKKEYELHECTLFEFLRGTADDRLERSGELTKVEKDKGLTDDFVRISDRVVLEIVDKAGPYISITLWEDETKTRHMTLESFSQTAGVTARAIDLNQDGKKELFLFFQNGSYWGAEWRMMVFEVDGEVARGL